MSAGREPMMSRGKSIFNKAGRALKRGRLS